MLLVRFLTRVVLSCLVSLLAIEVTSFVVSLCSDVCVFVRECVCAFNYVRVRGV
jgi:hypothetical protein